jgi:replication-associated recombination protein RarA
MNTSITIIPSELSHFLLHTALVRPVFIWGPPGIGKSSLVQQFAEEVGLPCISLLGTSWRQRISSACLKSLTAKAVSVRRP